MMLKNPWFCLSKRCPQTTRLLVLPLFLLGLLGFLVNTNIPFLQETLDICFPKQNIVFLKTHKCAGSSIQNIIMRYGDTHHLNFVLPRGGNYLGHPAPFNRTMVAKPLLPSYNILSHHTRLNYDEIRSFMPSNSVFITIVRNPIEVFESTYSYYGFKAVLGGDIHKYLSGVHLISNESLHQRKQNRKFGTNQMLFDLGADPGIFNDDALVRQYIDKLDNWFHLVLVADRMDESLVLLRNLMCWEMDDVVTFKLNARDPQFISSLSEAEKVKLRKINHADVLLYGHFVKKFDLGIEALGKARMAMELRQLRERTQSWYDMCVKGQQRHEKPVTKPKYYINPKVLRFQANVETNSTCRSMTIEELFYTDFLRNRQIRGVVPVGRKNETAPPRLAEPVALSKTNQLSKN